LNPDFITLPLIGRYPIYSDRDRQNAQRVNELVRNVSGAFGRSDDYGHITASAFILNETHDAVLLTHHAKLDLWLQLGGHCDGIYDPSFVALKEAYEESGLKRISLMTKDIFDIDIHTVPQMKGQKSHFHFDIRFLFECKRDHNFRVSSESKALRWVTLTQLSTYNSDHSIMVLLEKLALISADQSVQNNEG